MDTWSPAKRSDVMSRVRSKGNASTELKLLAIFRKFKVSGWRRHQKLFGAPDFVFRTSRVCVFVDGCFWHGCPRCYRRPKSNQEFWDAKVRGNVLRDRRVNRALRQGGWRVVRVWEHELTKRKSIHLRRKLWKAGLVPTRPITSSR
jgi:DNA mismatch endonuclease, patch repair protein